MNARPASRRGEQTRPDEAILRRLQQLISAGEGQQLEFKAKANHPDKIARSICALANSSGGTLLLGVDDNGKLAGIRYPDEDLHAINRFLRGARPSVKCRQTIVSLTEKKWVVVFEVRESRKKPVRLRADKDQVFYRHQDQCLQAGPVMTKVMERRSSPYGEVITFGDQEKSILQVLGDGAVRTLDSIARATGLEDRVLIPRLVSMVASGILRIIPGTGPESFRMNMP